MHDPAASFVTSKRPVVADAGAARHVMSVLVEDYFQVGAFRKHIEPDQWDRFESRLFRNTQAAIDLLARHDVRATFFVLGWNAEHWPELVRFIVDSGHEVASSGYQHENIRTTPRSEFCELVQRAREAIEAASGQPVLGYRIAEGWLKPDDLWLLDHLADEGYAYDSSLLARGRMFRSQPWRRFPHQHEAPAGRLWELPPSSLRLPLLDVPIAGGNYFRQIPHTLMKRIVANRDRLPTEPLMLYFHVWELDIHQPEISAVGRLTQIRHYRNLGKMNGVLTDYLSTYRFRAAADYLMEHDAELWHERRAKQSRRTPHRVHRTTYPTPRTRCCDRRGWNVSLSTPSELGSGCHFDIATRSTVPVEQPVAIVVPCYNEGQTVSYLAKTLESLRDHLLPEYRPQFILVDDGSVDHTWELLTDRWAEAPDVRLIRHEQNEGVAQAILTGIRAAETDVVCSMDCDCSYDPHKFKEMLPLLTGGVDLVTASPYHADGEVKNVPGWRLLLSRGASSLYRIVLGESLATYTSCFRVYRRQSVVDLPIENGGFLGIVELLGKLLLAGGKVVEYPATLNVRLFGHSKMKTLRTICGHLSLLRQLLWMRMTAKDGFVRSRAAKPQAMHGTVSRRYAAREPMT